MKILINISIITFDSITFLSKNTNFCFISTGLSFQEHYLRQALEILPLYEIHFTEKMKFVILPICQIRRIYNEG